MNITQIDVFSDLSGDDGISKSQGSEPELVEMPESMRLAEVKAEPQLAMHWHQYVQQWDSEWVWRPHNQQEVDVQKMSPNRRVGDWVLAQLKVWIGRKTQVEEGGREGFGEWRGLGEPGEQWIPKGLVMRDPNDSVDIFTCGDQPLLVIICSDSLNNHLGRRGLHWPGVY
ncbi:uncharacterized protein EI90DRAFT_3019416 [Cantharellus anzutake]|uniref:uncharacterized protein n=1 Tax=Cantharellus anzutake TaxID=1750568 RepID=UPI001906B4E8|nr:uncharacterized protein EI90DRAFT_3019416 [Cantharellus anzutake]KAF8324790.1 hypothetical protein EI90DRAFT_3019416 [Cantharellus anzutake]